MGFIDWFYDKFLWRRSESRRHGGLGPAVGRVIAQRSEAPEPKPAPARAAKHLKIGVVVGHEKAAPGAVMCAPYSIHEYYFNSEVAGLMFQYAKSRGVELEIFFRDQIGIAGAYKNARAAECDAVIELHFNSYDGHVYGTETLCSSAPEDKRLAAAVQNAMCALFGRSGRGDRGVNVMDSGRGSQSCVSFPGKANVLVEPAFCDNLQDAKMLTELKRPYAHCLVDAVIKTLAGD